MKCEDCYWRKPVVLEHPRTGLPHKLWYACWNHPTGTRAGDYILLKEDPVNCPAYITAEAANADGRKAAGKAKKKMERLLFG